MKIAARGLDIIKDFEKCRLSAYTDQKGVWTIGWGHTGPEVRKGVVWTQTQADNELAQDVAWAEKCINTSVRCKLSQNQFDALVSLVFNIGVGAFAASTMRKHLNNCDTIAAARQFARWNKVTDPVTKKINVSAGLTLRRAAEAALFNSEN